MNKLFESCDYHSREYYKGVLKSKGHNFILKTTPFNSEGGLMPILQHNFGLMIPWEHMSEQIGFLASNIFQHFICEWCRKWVIDTSII